MAISRKQKADTVRFSPMGQNTPRLRCLLRAKDGAAAVEFAFIAPVLIALIMGVISYGSYFWTAHTVQQMANDAARAAVAGLTDPERAELARSTLNTDMADQPMLDPTKLSVQITRNGTSLTVAVAYDARESVFATLGQLVPMPDTRIRRTASVRLGGF